MDVSPERALAIKERRQASMALARQARAQKLTERKTTVARINRRLSKLGIREAEDQARGALLTLLSDPELIAHARAQMLKPGKEAARWWEMVTKAVLIGGGDGQAGAPRVNVNTFVARPGSDKPETVIEVSP
jgi:hypothetical protein